MSEGEKTTRKLTREEIEKGNKLASEQEEIGKRIISTLTNVKKDSLSRRTKEHLQKKEQALLELIQQARKNQKKFQELEVPQHPYITSNYFETIEEKYEEAIKFLRTCSTAENLDAKTEEKNEMENPQSLRLKKQNVKITQFNKSIATARNKLSEDNTKIVYEILKNKLEVQWTAISELNEEITVYENEYKDGYFKNQIFEKTEEQYDEMMIELETKINQSSTSKPNIVLPKIQLPLFSGGYEEWCTFYDIFRKVIDANSNITKTEKMQYLKTHVRGEASRLIQHLLITEENYEAAWAILTKRYQNKRLIINKLMDQIINLPTIQHENITQLRRMHNTIHECLKAVENQGIDIESWGALIERWVSQKWDPETNRIYEQTIANNHEVQSLESLLEFLDKRCQSIEAAKPRSNNYQNYSPKFARCICGSHQHKIWGCFKFRSMSPMERKEVIRQNNRCPNCLGQHNSPCNSKDSCRQCGGKHNTLLHEEWKSPSRYSTTKPAFTRQQNPASGPFPANPRQNQPIPAFRRQEASNHQITRSSNSANYEDSMVLLATALICTKSMEGNTEYLRVLIDSGSQAALITEEAAQRLGYPKQKIKAEISGINDENPKMSKYKIQATIKPRFPSEFTLNTNFIILPKLTKNHPNQQLEIEISDSWNMVLADPTFKQPGPIDAILGAEELGQIIQHGLYKINDGIICQETKLGWILSGGMQQTINKPIKIISMISRYEEDKKLQQFWELEEITIKKPMGEENKKCEDHYDKNTIRCEDGKYTVKIPFKEFPPNLGESKQRALARFHQLEKKLDNPKNKELRNQYNAFMQDYMDLHHMTWVPHYNQGKYYIPHQPIIREDSTTTKLRVVFDASSKTTNGTSLNETMYTGPRLQQELRDILLRWRKYPIVVIADIEKMYRQIKISEEDKPFHHILWRFNNTQPIKEYRLNTVTYGTTSAPYLAIKTLQKLAQDEMEEFPQAAKTVLKDFYVDDLMSGAETINEATRIQSEIIKLLKSGGFNLRKWASNHQAVLDHLPEELKNQNITEITQEDLKKTLGVYWAPYNDTFQFKTQTSSLKITTKRTILSEIAKLFDPLGWLSPVIILAKLLIQELWVQKLDWDKSVPQNIYEKWTAYYTTLKEVEEIKIPRWINTHIDDTMELHGFCDASEKAYGAVIYVRTNKNGEFKTTLLIAKSKVAPVKTKASIPRLELCAAVLLAKLMDYSNKILEIPKVQQTAWTDSKITLAWIKGNPERWNTFVANRVSEINNLLPAQYWKYVKTSENPADLISRGIQPSKIKQNTLWWNGPKWLQEEILEAQTDEIPNTKLEQKRCFNLTVKNNTNTIIERFSSLTKMLRVLSYCNRFYKRTWNKSEQGLKVAEIQYTLQQIIKRVQEDTLRDEIVALKNKTGINKKSKIISLNPYLDNNILRVGGRLKNSILPVDQKHPIILPNQNHFTTLIIRDAHHQTLHGGNQQTLAYTRRKYWIINRKRAVQAEIKKCVVCIRHKAETVKQLMGDLPAARVTPAPPFLYTGVDYAGPIIMKMSKGRGNKTCKGYIAIFVCLATKAIHLEAVTDLTTDAFLAAFRRFTSRRGNCEHIYSDNGTNFVGANNIIKKEIRNILNNDDFQNKLGSQGTQWHFIPPATPHVGGLWEAAVKSMKHHFTRIVGENKLTFEEISTLLCQIEACLNSRPLCAINNSMDDLETLTPGHFLIGREILSPTHPANTMVTAAHNSRWKLVQKIKKDMWKAWSSDYLNKLQQRYKWQSIQKNPEVGDVVLLKEKDIRPSQWPLAKICETHPDPDGTLRVVTVKKAKGQTTKRSVHNIIPLIEESANNTEQPKSSHVQSMITRKKNGVQRTLPTQIIISLLILSNLITTSKANINITKMEAGLYIEHLGTAIIERGLFQMEIKYSIQKLNEDKQSVGQVTQQFDQLCNTIKEIHPSTICHTMSHHLHEGQTKMNWIEEELRKDQNYRKRRGFLGEFMTSIFGVNDEVYQDIDDIQKNQQELINTANHQTKFMLSAISTFNDTEQRINTQLEHWRTKLNQAIKTIQEWEQYQGQEKLEIQILTSFQIANNYIIETCNYYESLLQLKFGRGNLHDLISPAHVNKVISKAQQKISASLQIIRSPIVKTKVTTNDKYIHVFSHFVLAGRNKFALIKINPIPLKIKKNLYWTTEISNPIFAIDYNMQLYFEMNSQEFKETIRISEVISIYSPVTVKNFDTTPNCVIDQIYNRPNPLICKTTRKNITNTIWKQLYTPNAWMVITPNPIRVDVICKDQRQEQVLNQSSIIQISQECIVKTKQNVLTPIKVRSQPILASYHKQIQIENTTFTNYNKKPSQLLEPVLTNSEDIQDLLKTEKDISQDLTEHHWTRIKHHSIISNIITGLVILLIIGCCILGYRCRKHSSKSLIINKTNQGDNPTLPEMIELNPL